ncbi:transmembrane protein, putative (macronuclear) [Tetrahymena thermophila SB210]|uniref:Transmembrane protein, putative n=1 Tax=Tetrahymena thermophila (strain SB210) TaxID=312017 RepID=W7X5J0_TETTS|nr:transmembrane protein, putative [Tetrahymena thermophila SB210]EWS72662.1 transmembrane protein, putative [Tetrahymena thermophila SB210]|eukprot:XP_012654787.1 transmembrane protein, putative [Tetrahymena thermophila SB210]
MYFAYLIKLIIKLLTNYKTQTKMSLIRDSSIKIYRNYGKYLILGFVIQCQLCFFLCIINDIDISPSGIQEIQNNRSISSFFVWMSSKLIRFLFFNGLIMTAIEIILVIKWIIETYLSLIKYTVYFFLFCIFTVISLIAFKYLNSQQQIEGSQIENEQSI